MVHFAMIRFDGASGACPRGKSVLPIALRQVWTRYYSRRPESVS